MNKKRLVAAFVPYRTQGVSLEFFLQKRSVGARTSPDMVGVFGGGVEEGETVEQGLLREIDEELCYRPRELRYFSKFENASFVSHVFIEEVGPDFESIVTVREGQYGRFFTVEQVRALPDITDQGRVIVAQVSEYLQQ